ncbi:MAG: polymerase epsilon subunit [Devosia sp.]|nr:polymerase epsilon subunit [Devosia sp.]
MQIMTREIVLDTETTGLSPQAGDRVVELGCVELINHIPTGKSLHHYFNPQRSMPEDAFRVHGLSESFLSDKPLFGAVADEFIHFIGDATLIIHNAPFDMGFLNAELASIRRPPLTNAVIDTVMLARQVHPGARVSLDALCKHYGIDNSRRALHGALLDSEILAEVYLELIGGRQVAFALAAETAASHGGAVVTLPVRQRPEPLPPRLTAADLAAHAAFIAALAPEPLWNKYLDMEKAAAPATARP